MARQELTTELFGASRRRSSANGNPSFKLHTEAGMYDTQADASIGYEVENIVSRIPENGSITVTIKMTTAHKVWDITVEAMTKEKG